MNRIPLLLASLLALPLQVQACAAISYDPDDPIQTTDESALIVWNSKTRVEQFVRRASFQTKAKDFGFLVPTPTQPTLSARDDAIFNNLEFELLPKQKTVVQRGPNFTPLLSSFSSGDEDTAAAVNSAASSGENSVEVIEEKRVGDYNSTVLRASDPASLTKWLRAHRYAVSSDTLEWLAPYVKAGFFITAFQIAANANAGSAHAEAVQLSFKTDVPYFPYRETKNAQKIGGGRTLRVFYVGEGRVEGTIETEGKTAKWPASIGYSAPLDAAKLRAHGVDVPSGNLRLTAFEDDSSPRPGWGDLKFAPSNDQSEKTPPPIITLKDERFPLPLDVLVLAGLSCIWMLRKRGASQQS